MILLKDMMEHTIIDVEAGRQVKEPQSLKHCMRSQRFAKSSFML
jgi:hypothetical protein